MTTSIVEWSDADIRRHLVSSPVFGSLDAAAIERLAESADVIFARAGDVVMVEGDPGEEAFIVVAGRLQVVTGDDTDEPEVVGTAGPGDVVGEMSLITDEPRSATVRASRDAALVRLPAAEFRSIMADDHRVLLDVTRTVMSRLNRSIHGDRPMASVNVIGIVPTGPDGVGWFVSAFADVLDRRADVAVVRSPDVANALGPDPSRTAVAQYLHNIEDRHDLVVLVGELIDPEWTDLCRRQSDVTLLVGTWPMVAPSDAPVPASSDHRGGAGDSPHLVLVHDGEPLDTALAMAHHDVERCHHVRVGSIRDVERVVRIVTGTSLGLVLSGGGARGFAHLGVVRALIEAGVPIDHVGGASIGAAVAAAFAYGGGWEQMVDMVRAVTVGRGSLVDTTLPAVALGRGRRLTEGIRAVTGDTDIEDLWMEYFSVSTDLTAASARVHASGPVWRAIRASVAIPGIFPPVKGPDGHVLVDGAVLDNLPVDVMRATFSPSRVLAVDLRAPTMLQAEDLPFDGDVSGWAVARRRLAPWAQPLDVPRIVDLLLVSSMVSGHATPSAADIVLRPPVAGFGILDFSAGERLIDAGYRYTVDALESLDVDPFEG